MLQTNRAEICLLFIILSRVMLLKLSKKVCFLQFCDDFCKKAKSVKAIYILHLTESYHYTLSENDMVSRGLSHHS